MLEFSKLWLIFIIASFVGWIIEELYALFKNHELVNRGFLVGPLCPIYGICVLFFILVLNSFKDNIVLLFIISTILVSVIEYLISLILDKALHIRLWDYEKMNFKYQINGRIAVATLIPFGLLGVATILYLYPAVSYILNLFDENFIYTTSLCVFIIFIVDFIFSVKILKEIGKSNNNRSIDVTKIKSKIANDKIKNKLKNK